MTLLLEGELGDLEFSVDITEIPRSASSHLMANKKGAGLFSLTPLIP